MTQRDRDPAGGVKEGPEEADQAVSGDARIKDHAAAVRFRER